MLTLRQLGQRVGYLSGGFNLNEVASVMGIFKPYNYIQVASAAAREEIPKPFYVIGHNTNTIAEVREALARGANAVEVDVNTYNAEPNVLCIAEEGGLIHGKLLDGGHAEATAMQVFLEELNVIAKENLQLALVMFDCKSRAATPDHGLTIFQSINSLLIKENANLNIIISVPKFNLTGIFDHFKNQITPRMGLMIDEENDPEGVASTLAPVENRCYGNGIASILQKPILTPHIRPAVEKACSLRGIRNDIRFVYTWSIGDPDYMREYIRIGVNGIIPGKPPSVFDAQSVSTLIGVTQEDDMKRLVRLATRNENPFTRPETAYVLQVKTGTRHNAGTDANVRFTLKGPLGQVSKWVDTSLAGSLLSSVPGRMENGALDFVNIQSFYLGPLESISVQKDSSGNAPDWDLDFIMIGSFRYGVSQLANFNHWIEKTETYTRGVQ